jgi:homocitrate synthase NifV
LIQVIDRTLSCLDRFRPDRAQLLALAALLAEAGADKLELSESAYACLREHPCHVPAVLRVRSAADAVKYPEISGFVCPPALHEISEKICVEIRVNDMHETYTFSKSVSYPHVRVRGLDNVLTYHYQVDFAGLSRMFSPEMEFCPTNRDGCATAAAVEWALNGTGRTVVTSFGGIGGFAAFEEVIMALRHVRRRKVGKNYPEFPNIRNLVEQITGVPFAPDKPVIGKEIFCVKSGIHVDGILKQPRCYTPFLPEEAGQSHTILLGKQSGMSAVSFKANEMGLNLNGRQTARLLQAVKAMSERKNGNLTDAEFAGLAQETSLPAEGSDTS